MNVSAWSIRNPIPAILLFIVLVALGLMAFSGLPVTRFPNIDIPLVSVTVTDPGVAPSELKTQITKRIEDAVANISGVKNVITELTKGVSKTTVEFRLEVDTQTAVNDVKDAVELIQADLPATSDDPVVARIDVEGQAILTYAVSAPAMTIEELSWFVDDTIIRKMVPMMAPVAGISTIIALAIEAAYFSLLWASGGRATIGMRLLKLQVGDATSGNRIPIATAFRRWLGFGAWLNLIAFVPVLGAFASLAVFAWQVILLVTTATHPQKMGLHDRFANTAMVRPANASNAAGIVIGCLLIVVAVAVLSIVALIFLGGQVSAILSEVGESV